MWLTAWVYTTALCSCHLGIEKNTTIISTSMYDSDRGMFRFFIVWLEFTEFEGKISFCILTLSKNRPCRGYAGIAFHCCVLMPSSCQTQGHNSTECQVSMPQGRRARKLPIYAQDAARERERETGRGRDARGWWSGYFQQFLSATPQLKNVFFFRALYSLDFRLEQ